MRTAKWPPTSEGTREQGIVKGERTSTSGMPVISLNYLSKQANLQPGQKVLTSGVGGVFPPGYRRRRSRNSRRASWMATPPSFRRWISPLWRTCSWSSATRNEPCASVPPAAESSFLNLAVLVFFIILLVAMFVARAEHFIPPLPGIGARVILMPLVMITARWRCRLGDARAGLCRRDDVRTPHTCRSSTETSRSRSAGRSSSTRHRDDHERLPAAFSARAVGGALPAVRGLHGLHPARGVSDDLHPAAAGAFVFTHEIWWRIGGAGLIAVFLAPFFFFDFNYIAYLVGYDPSPESPNADR